MIVAVFPFIPPQPVAREVSFDLDREPQLDQQIEEIFEYCLGLEHRFRSAFVAVEHVQLLFGVDRPLPERHRCSAPPPRNEDPWTRCWRCDCGQAWMKPPWYSGWTPVSDEVAARHAF